MFMLLFFYLISLLFSSVSVKHDAVYFKNKMFLFITVANEQKAV